MSHYPSIHDAYGGFGEKNDNQLPTHSTIKIKDNENSNTGIHLSNEELEKQKQQFPNSARIPTDASHSNYPVRVKCPKCHKIGITRMQSELGTASWVWCVLLSPFLCSGLSCLCFESCRDKVHFCERCGNVVGKKFAKVC